MREHRGSAPTLNRRGRDTVGSARPLTLDLAGLDNLHSGNPLDLQRLGETLLREIAAWRHRERRRQEGVR